MLTARLGSPLGSPSGPPLTFGVQLHVDDVTHNGSAVQVLDGFLGSPDRGEDHLGNAQVLLGLGVVQNLHLLHLPILLAHVPQEVFADVIIQLGKCHLLWRHWAHIELIDLAGAKGEGSLENIETKGKTTFLTRPAIKNNKE